MTKTNIQETAGDGKCVSVATQNGGSTACCYAKFAAGKLKIAKEDGTADIDISESAVSGSKVASTVVELCFAAGAAGTSQAIVNAGAIGGSANTKEIFFSMTDYCGADGKTATSKTSTSTYWYFAGTDFTTTATEIVADNTAAARRMLATTREGVVASAAPAKCVCGTSTMPTDGCAALTATDVSTKCTATKESSTAGAALCCLATFDTAPLVKKAGKAVESAAKGAEVKSSKFYACYKKTSGKFRFKTASGATPASKSGWVSADAFCASTKVGKD